MTKPMVRRISMITLLLAGAGGATFAQSSGIYDPAQLPTTKGRVGWYSLMPRGDVDGLILEDGTEVHLPPHLGAALVQAVKPGDAVTIHGLKARTIAMVQALQVTNDATGKSVTDTGPPPAGADPKKPVVLTKLEAQGVVKEPLHGPQGDLNGVLLQDGTIVRLPPAEATRREAALAAGKTLYVRGKGVDSILGRVIEAQAIGTSAQDAVTLPAIAR